MRIPEEDIKHLIEKASKARERAYAPYSKFAVGAAVLTEDGHIFTGANVENASYSMTVCAERMAIGAAVNAGDKKITALAVIGGHIELPKKWRKTPPCGACRQVMAEFMPEDALVIAASLEGSYDTYILKNLLPVAFKLEDPKR
jgi:cytidine deaminase